MEKPVSQYEASVAGAAQLAVDRWEFHRPQVRGADEEAETEEKCGYHAGACAAYSEMSRLLTGRPASDWEVLEILKGMKLGVRKMNALKALEKLEEKSSLVLVDITEEDTGWFYDFHLAILKAREVLMDSRKEADLKRAATPKI